MLTKLMDFLRYRATPTGQGVGVMNLAFDPVARVPYQSPYNPAYNVQRQLYPLAPSFYKAAQDVPTIPIEGNGLALQGQLALQALVEANREGEKR